MEMRCEICARYRIFGGMKKEIIRLKTTKRHCERRKLEGRVDDIKMGR